MDRHYIAVTDRSHRLGSYVKAITDRPPFQQMKHDRARCDRGADRSEPEPSPGATGEKESWTRW